MVKIEVGESEVLVRRSTPFQLYDFALHLTIHAINSKAQPIRVVVVAAV